jgi:UDP-glucose 4-epimerase
VDFSLFKALAPDWAPQVTLDQSIGRLLDGLSRMDFVDKDFRNSSYARLKTLERHISSRRMDNELRWRDHRSAK